MSELSDAKKLYNEALKSYGQLQHYQAMHKTIIRNQVQMTLNQLGKYAPKFNTEQQKINFVMRLGKNLRKRQEGIK